MVARDNRFYSVYTKEEFTPFAPSGVTFSETTPLSTNQWTYDNTLKAFQIKTDNSKPGMVVFDLGYLYTGDIIEVEAEVMNISGTKARISIDQANDAEFEEDKVTDFIYCNGENGFDIYNFHFVVKKEGYHKVAVGNWTAHAGEIAIRNPRVRVQSRVKYVGRPDYMRIANLRKVSEGFQIRTDFAHDQATVSVEGDNILKITWKKPFVGLRPIVLLTEEYFPSGNTYQVRSSNNTNYVVRIAFYDDDTDEQVSIASLPNDTHVAILAIN